MTLLQIDSVSKKFGGLTAISDLDFTVSESEFVAVIGPNGAGKSTFLNVVTGLSMPSAGMVLFEGRNITNAPTHKRIRAGLGRTFQHGRLFPRLSVLENVMTGAAIKAGQDENQIRQCALDILDRMGLASEADKAVDSLSYGQRRMVELCRALACGPNLLMLDEPAAGLNSGEVELLIDRLNALRKEHRLAIVLIEHNMGMVMRLASRILVLNFGCKIAEGTPAEIQSDPAVLSAYLGEGYVNAQR